MSSQLKWAFRKWITTYALLKVLSGSSLFWFHSASNVCTHHDIPPCLRLKAMDKKTLDRKLLTINQNIRHFITAMKSGYFFSNGRVEQFNETILLACPNHSYLPFCWQSLPMFDLEDDSEFFYGFGGDY